MMQDPEWSHAVDVMLENALIKVMSSSEHVDIDTESYEEMKSLADEMDFGE